MRKTMLTTALIAAPAALILAACGDTTSQTPAGAPEAAAPATTAPAARAPVGATARANLTNGEGASAGTATFRQGPTGVLIRVEATGLTPGWHGLHLHQVGTCEGPGFQSAGSHVQHGGQTAPHGLLNADGNDAGDLPNLYVGADGRGFAEVFTTTARLADSGPGEALLGGDGSSILIHAQPDDYTSQPIGGSGDRVACGVIAAG